MNKIDRFMKTNIFYTLALGALLGLASCADDNMAQHNPGGNADTNDDGLTTFIAEKPTDTRTSMNYANGAFFWEEGDKIWVKDDDGTWQKSSNAPTAKTASFKFKVPGKFTGNTYTVYYPGKGKTNNKVTIAAAQTQTEPDDTKHFGTSGDCGIGTAVKSGVNFNFTIKHEPTILVFNLTAGNAAFKKCHLTRIEVTATDNITGKYTLTAGGLAESIGAKQIILTTKGAPSSPTEKGFALSSNNRSYMIIRPGKHTLKVRFWLKDYSTGIEGTVTKSYPEFTYAPNTYYNMPTSSSGGGFDSRSGASGNNYYMWDAKENYWYGYEWNHPNHNSRLQPTDNGGCPNYSPQPGDANRYANTTKFYAGVGEGSTPLFNPAYTNHVPNANEMSWYQEKGDPHWDANELWATMGRLHKGGMWFKKRTNIPGFNSNVCANNSTDMRSTFRSVTTHPSHTPLTAAEQTGYFFLPPTGYYKEGYLSVGFSDLGITGFYWSSSACPLDLEESTVLIFSSTDVNVYRSRRNFGYVAAPFRTSSSTGEGPFFE